MRTFVSRLVSRTAQSVSGYPSGSQVLGLARTIIAVSQLAFLLTTPTSNMFVPVGHDAAMAGCSRPLGGLSLFCHGDPDAARVAAILMLVLVASGLFPRVISWLHVYLALSIGTSIDLPEGGDHVALVATIWIAFASLDDDRITHWMKPSSVAVSPLKGAAWAGSWMLKLQIAFIYFNSAMAKTFVEAWQDGTATYYVFRMEYFGSVGPLGELIRWATSVPLIAIATTWGTIAIELAIAILLLCQGRLPMFAVALSVALHVGIIIGLGLFSFGVTMIGAVLAAAAPAFGGVFRKPRADYRDGQEAIPPSVGITPATSIPEARPRTLTGLPSEVSNTVSSPQPIWGRKADASRARS